MIDFYCIYKKDDERSESLLSDCIESGRIFDIKVTPYEGIYSNIDKILENEKLSWSLYGSKKSSYRGVKGCFLSHYFLWQESVKTNRTIGVLEYDAIFINPISDEIINNFKYYLNLDYNRHLYLNNSLSKYLKATNAQVKDINIESFIEQRSKSKNINNSKYINKNHIKGAFGYIITPEGAAILLSAAKNFGILPADVHPNLLYLKELNYTSSSVVMLNPKSLNDRAKMSHTNNDFTE